MSEKEQENPELLKIKDFIKAERFDDASKIIALYLGDSTDEDYLDRLENIIETLLTSHGGRIVLRFLIEQLIIDIPSLLENLSKRDSLLRYSFLILLKSVCENEQDLFFPFSEDLLDSEDPNVREADLQLIIFMAGGDIPIDNESLINKIAEKLSDIKDFVVEKAIQALKAIGKNNPSLVTKVIKNYTKQNPEDEKIRISVDNILKSIVSIEKIEEIVEDEGKEKQKLEDEEIEIIDKEIELKQKGLELKKKKLDIEQRETELEEKIIVEKDQALKLKEEIIDKEKLLISEKEITELPKKIKKKIQKEEAEILDKEIELKQKELELKKKKLELESKEKEIEELEIQKKEEMLKRREELLEKESQLSEVELELQQKKIEDQKQKIVEDELKRMEKRIKDLEEKQEKDNSES
ncbi:MAG: hypothetical protein ACFE8E_04680 [Candidatus Hodarchaeota archaeon]